VRIKNSDLNGSLIKNQFKWIGLAARNEGRGRGLNRCIPLVMRPYFFIKLYLPKAALVESPGFGRRNN
jgi:hypothetical protein